jgi:peptidoglycan hydrolase-like protein with peptidoglycan-binding domain
VISPFVDTKDLLAGTTYYYAFFSIDTSSLPSIPAQTSAKVIVSTGATTVSRTLIWISPATPDYLTTTVVRKEGSIPTSPQDGTIVYTGTNTRFTDTVAVGANPKYAVFAISQKGVATSLNFGFSLASQSGTAGAGSGATTTPVMSPKNPSLVLSKNLQLGMRDSEVQRLQRFLQLLAYFPTSETPTMYFGKITQGAVVAYQKAEGISPASGYVGPITRARLSGGTSSSGISAGSLKASAITRTLRYGMEGEDIKILQAELKSRGHLTPVTAPTGYFGPATLAAVKKFQCEKLEICSGAPETNGYGSVGPRTRTMLGI